MRVNSGYRHIDPADKKAAIKLMKAGMATPVEIANLLGRSPQSIHYWAQGIDWQQARLDWIAWQFKRRRP